MGKGDQRSKKGKIRAGSYGNSRRKKSTAKVTVTEKPAKKAAKKSAKS